MVLDLIAVQAYVQSLGKPELLDLVARSDAMDIDKNEAEDLRPNKKAVVYAEVCL
jgi:exosome complex exonuclease DIS3/RRP44